MRRLGLVLGAALLFGGVLLRAGGRHFVRVAVSGHSMEPGLEDGDWLLVDRSEKTFIAGDVVVARDPRNRERLIVKRVGEVGTDSQLWLRSDHPAHADEVIGPVDRSDVVGRARMRYWPVRRLGLLDGTSGGTPDSGAARKAVALSRQGEERSVDQ